MLVERRNQGNGDEAEKDGRTAHGCRDPADPENAHDVVWRGRLRTDSRGIVVVVLVEVQSTVETKMALRLLGHMTAAEGSAKREGGGRSNDEFRTDAGPVILEKTERQGWENGRVEERKATAVRLMAEGMDARLSRG